MRSKPSSEVILIHQGFLPKNRHNGHYKVIKHLTICSCLLILKKESILQLIVLSLKAYCIRFISITVLTLKSTFLNVDNGQHMHLNKYSVVFSNINTILPYYLNSFWFFSRDQQPYLWPMLHQDLHFHC